MTPSRDSSTTTGPATCASSRTRSSAPSSSPAATRSPSSISPSTARASPGVSPKTLAARRTKLDADSAALEDRREALEEDEADVADAGGNGANGGSLKNQVAELERQLIKEALDRAGGNRTKAAEELGIYRRLLYAKIKEYGLEE